jgi:hypothetical protein
MHTFTSAIQPSMIQPNLARNALRHMLRRTRVSVCRMVSSALALCSVAAASSAPAAALQIERIDVGRADVAIFVMSGKFVAGDTLNLQREVSKIPPTVPVSVILDSGGGDLQEGFDLGRFFHSAKITTFVQGNGGTCASACSLAFLGGRDRVTGKPARITMLNGQLGFHQFNRPRSDETKAKVFRKDDMDREVTSSRNVIYNIILYLNDIGEDMTKLHQFLRAPSESMNWITPEDAINLGIHLMYENKLEFIESTNIRARVK